MGKTNKEDALAVSWRCCPQVLGLAKAANQGHAGAAKRGELSWRCTKPREDGSAGLHSILAVLSCQIITAAAVAM
jgi:hypothetical protein